MKFYLKWVNPAVAILILLICCWLYFGGYFIDFGEGKSPFTEQINILDTDEMGFSMYFFAKGLFCSSMLFLIGELLKKYLNHSS